ncbi:hypothetical protein [uncultured Brevundimonas sp.]|uniref:hypothetical protein n=1 Tax=uncultured Brevundimonas sp. TaxID=213418 RepID=UPI0025F5781C|nr:hypothetical protein [uncultured Brevundimonas sp.]
MGYKKPENRGLGHHLSVAPHMTVSQLRRDHWTISTRCPRCHLDCWVDLTVVIRLSGPQVKLWNRWARCRRYGCPGRMVFLFTPPGEPKGVFWPMHDPPEARVKATISDDSEL